MTPRIFGQLVFIRLSEDHFESDKADTPGRPAAFLCFNEKTRRGMMVACRTKRDKLAVKTIDPDKDGDGASAFWPAPSSDGSPQMAFRHVVRDLRILSVPDGAPDDDEPSDVPPLAAPQPGAAVEGAASQPPPRWVDLNSSCPACRGRQRAHVRSGTCLFRGLSTKIVQDMRKRHGVTFSDWCLAVRAASEAVEKRS